MNRNASTHDTARPAPRIVSRAPASCNPGARPAPPIVSRARAMVALAISALALIATAPAQSIADLLPAETIFAVGTQDLEASSHLFEDFLTEFEERGVGEALAQLFGAAGEEAADVEMDVPAALRGLGPLDLLGRDAWLAISASQFNPFPAASLAARTSPEATAAVAELIAEASARPDVQALSEGGVTFYVAPLDEPDAPIQAIAFAQSGDLLLAATNPDVLRGLLRRLAGSGEPSFTTAESYARTLGRTGRGEIMSFLDLGAVAQVVAPFAQGFGFAPQIERLQRALATAGATAGTTRLTSSGIESTSILAPDPDGGDIALYNLITTRGSWDPRTIGFAPETALTFTSSTTDLTGWWNWLNDLVGTLPELGIQSLDRALIDFVGIDLRSSFFDWTGIHNAAVTTGYGDPSEPGMPTANLLGEQVFLVETIDESAAREGLATLFGNLAATVGAFADPTGGAGAPQTDEREVAGVTVTRYRVTDGIAVSTAVAGGYALIATADEAMEAVLGAVAAGAGPSVTFDQLLAGVPADARSITLSDSRAVTESTALQLSAQLQLAAGLGGSANLDFAAVAEATERIEDYLLFVASRLGGSASHSAVEDGAVVTRGRTAVSW